jgi:hypothetical protein
MHRFPVQLCHVRLDDQFITSSSAIWSSSPRVRPAISLCSFPYVAKSSACASFVAISTLECLFFLAIAACFPCSPITSSHMRYMCARNANRIFGSPLNWCDSMSQLAVLDSSQRSPDCALQQCFHLLLELGMYSTVSPMPRGSGRMI